MTDPRPGRLALLADLSYRRRGRMVLAWIVILAAVLHGEREATRPRRHGLAARFLKQHRGDARFSSPPAVVQRALLAVFASDIRGSVCRSSRRSFDASTERTRTADTNTGGTIREHADHRPLQQSRRLCGG